MAKSKQFHSDLRECHVTPESDYLNRRRFMQQAGAALGAASLLPLGFHSAFADDVKVAAGAGSLAEKLLLAPTTMTLPDKRNSFEEITQYNNFYELGTDKSDPAQNAASLSTSPWSITVSGHCAKPGTLHLEDILKPHAFEERIYRLRCVEGWSMVIPWLGFPLADFLARFEPTSDARFVAFETLYDKSRPLPGQRRQVIHWPYREGLRIDEALHPLSFLAVGLYGKTLPNQNGAPIRLVVPWKYGFKSIKSIVAIRFVSEMPETSWNTLQAREYGFYSNVNPEVDHPRWSQARERRIGELFKRETLMFNGYAEQVASLYKGMDLRKFY